MKKKVLLIFLISILLLSGCKKKDDNKKDETPEKIDYNALQIYHDVKNVDEYRTALNGIVQQIIENNQYKEYETEKGVYIITLKQMSDELKYDTSLLDTYQGIPCDKDKVSVRIDATTYSPKIIPTLDIECIHAGNERIKASLENTESETEE